MAKTNEKEIITNLNTDIHWLWYCIAYTMISKIPEAAPFALFILGTYVNNSAIGLHFCWALFFLFSQFSSDAGRYPYFVHWPRFRFGNQFVFIDLLIVCYFR